MLRISMIRYIWWESKNFLNVWNLVNVNIHSLHEIISEVTKSYPKGDGDTQFSIH